MLVQSLPDEFGDCDLSAYLELRASDAVGPATASAITDAAAAGRLSDQAVTERLGGRTVLDYQDSVPHLADRFARYDLFVERFALSCLNRLQLRNNRQMVDLADPAGALRLVGTLDNPIARFGRRKRS